MVAKMIFGSLLILSLFVYGNCSRPLFEGDIRVFYPQLVSAYGDEFANFMETKGHVTDDLRRRRLGGIGKWPAGVVPYTIDKRYFDVAGVKRLDTIMEGMTSKLSPYVTFKKWAGEEPDYIVFKKVAAEGCWSYIGKIGGGQTINIGCLKNVKQWTSTVEHEVLHALGVWHEQSRPDRDKYVKVNDENIMEGFEAQFVTRVTQDDFLEYDYGSVMHYGANAFSKNGKPTLESINPPGVLFGVADAMSDVDVAEVRIKYGEPLPVPTTPPTATPTPRPTLIPCDRFTKRRPCRNRKRRCRWDKKSKTCKFK